tara:strand:+ start:28 stop:522 length:495 start_codon:yes stop_codon:yes gene_type:complete
MSSNKSVDCYDCRYPVKLNDEEWEEWEKQEGFLGRCVMCSKCRYKHNILRKEIDKNDWRSGVQLRPSKFEVGKFHIFLKFGEANERMCLNNVNRHFIIDIIKITKCFVSYKLKEIYINGYHNDDTVHKRKIQTQARYVPQIAYPKNFDVRHETIKINELWRITE